MELVASERQRVFNEQGYVIVRKMFSARQVAEIRDTFTEAARNGPVEGLSETQHSGRAAYDGADPLARYPRMMHPHRHLDKAVGVVARKYMLLPEIGRLLEELMGEEPVAVQSMFYFKPPGARGQDRSSQGHCSTVL